MSGSTAVGEKPSVSSSWRLYSESPKASEHLSANVASSTRPRMQLRAIPRLYGANHSAGVMLW